MVKTTRAVLGELVTAISAVAVLAVGCGSGSAPPTGNSPSRPPPSVTAAPVPAQPLPVVESAPPEQDVLPWQLNRVDLATDRVYLSVAERDCSTPKDATVSRSCD